ncbi:MAG: hypothetical protein DMG57_21785 [Acidobacteria bacterium]|nr:MAG: hypothetical protein DMG57_21785 [Acidobacteriota bacterium]
MVALDALNRIVQNDLHFAYPARMHLGAGDQARLSSKRDLNSQLTTELAARGVPLSESASIVTIVISRLVPATTAG